MDENGPPYQCDSCGGKHDFLLANMWIWPIVFVVCEGCNNKMPDIQDEQMVEFYY